MFQGERDGPPASVDVAIPCYQYGRFLRDCVTSVLTQDIRDLRVLIIDNASTDDSVEIAQQLAAEDRRVEVVAHRRNLGQHASFNEAIDWASSTYFMIACADDCLAPGCLQRAASVMERHPDVGLTYGRFVYWHRPQDPRPVFDTGIRDASWRIVPGKHLLQQLCRLPHPAANFIYGPTVVVRTSVQKRVGYYRPELPHTDDLEMWMRFACLGAVAETDAVQAIVGAHPTRRSDSRDVGWDRLFEDALDNFLANEGGLLPEADRLRRTARRSLAARAYWRAVLNLLGGGDLRQSLNLWRFAFVRSPTTIVVPPVSYLFRRSDAFRRIIEVVPKAVRQPGKPLEGDVGR